MKIDKRPKKRQSYDVLTSSDSCYELKKNNRFIVEFPFPEEYKIDPWLVQKINGPTYDVLNDKWENMIIEFIDPIGPSVTQRLFHISRLMNEEKYDRDFIFFIISTDPTGVDIERWEILGKFKRIEFVNNDYNNDEPRIVKLEIIPINCILKY